MNRSTRSNLIFKKFDPISILGKIVFPNDPIPGLCLRSYDRLVNAEPDEFFTGG